MIVTEVPVELWIPESQVPRSEGTHVSSIIRCIAIEDGILTADEEEELSLVSNIRKITDPVALLRINIGLAWEQYYIPNLLPTVVDHPGEMCCNGIYMTHDGEDVSTVLTPRGPRAVIVVHEIKATYKSTRTVGDLTTKGSWMWMAQVKSYCKGLNTLHACLHVLFLCGDYMRPIRPIPKRWNIEFTPEEIESNWQLIKDYKEHRERISLYE